MSNSDLQRAVYETGFRSDDEAKLKRYKESCQIRIEKLNRFLRELEGKRVANLGCGNGFSLSQDFYKGNRVVGIDISETLLREAEAFHDEVILSDLEEGIPLEDRSVDAVIATELLEHMVDTDFFLGEVNRVLKEDGLLIVTTPNVNTLLSHAMMAFFDLPPYRSARYRSPHVRDFTGKTLRIALEGNGFKIRHLVGSALFIPYAGYFLKGLCDRLPRLGETFIASAVKVREVPVRKGEVQLALI